MANNSELDAAFKELEEDFGYAKEARREVIRMKEDIISFLPKIKLPD